MCVQPENRIGHFIRIKILLDSFIFNFVLIILFNFLNFFLIIRGFVVLNLFIRYLIIPRSRD